ncbi:Protein fem-1-like C [Stylophora pistillata]|uniref:Protein fem-1-like C n=1 Tax=Stylophora pistillata TaxID=50429 RepID=A0A2B4S3V8_STYPI|nr:Protein fem-1-like C [Stylophora pistillata]
MIKLHSFLLFLIAQGRSIVSFILNESFQDITANKVLSFKKSLCKYLTLIRAEFTFVTTVKTPRKHLVLQLPSEVLPFLRHCTGWRKEWLFSLNVSAVKVSGEDEISVQELKISQLRLQEDPVLVSPVLRVSEAARTGDVSELKRVLDIESITKRDFLLKTRTDGATPLIIAARNGNTAIVQCLLDEYDVDLEQEGTVKIDGDLIECCTPLWMGSLGGHLAIVRLLLERGAEVNHTTLTNSTPLRAASFNGHTEVVRCLINHGADVNKRNQDGNTCIMVACWNGHLDTFGLLRTSGANMEVQDNQGFSMIHCATAANNLTLLHELLPVPNTAAVNAKTSEGITPLMLACEKNHPDVVLLLLQKGAAVDEKSDKGLTAAHFCALSNDINSLHHIIDYRADLSMATERGSTPLMLACAKGYVSIVTALLRNTCKSKLKNEITSALKLRNLTGHPSCLGLLATPKGMDINAGNENAETCLMMACEKGSVEIVRILLDEGADPNCADQNGVTPLMICCRRGQERIIPLLLRKGVLVDQKNNEGDTALHICVRHYREFSGHKKCLEQLLSTGVCLDMKNSSGDTPVTVALKNKKWCGQAFEMLHSGGLELSTPLQDTSGDTVFHKCGRSGDVSSMTLLLALDNRGPLQKNQDGDTALRAAALEGAEAMTRALINTVSGFSPKDKVEALELLGVGVLAKEISRDWDISAVVGFWQEALTLRRTHSLTLPNIVPREFPLEYFFEARLPSDLTAFESNPSAVTAQALQICDRVLGDTHSRLPSLLGTIGERFAQIGEFYRSLNIWLYVLEIQLKSLSSLPEGVEDVLNTFRCFADAFGFVLSRSGSVLHFKTVYQVVKSVLQGLKTCPAIYESRDKMMVYLLHYLSALLEVSSNDRDVEVVTETVKAVAWLGLRSTTGSTLLHLAANSKTEDISSLKEHLHFPSRRVCELLMDSGIDQNAVDSDRNTALHILLTKGHAERDVLACLLKARPHLDARNSSGKTVLDLARCKKVWSFVRAAERVPRLQCLAARKIIGEKLQYEGIVPKRLETFIQLH